MNRILNIIITMGLVVSLTVGCSKKDQSSEGTSTSSVTSANSSKAESAKGKVKLKILAPSNVEQFPAGENENNNKIISYLKEKTGYDIKWEIMPKENAREKINLMMTSGDAPDLINTGDRSMCLDYVKEGVLHPVDDYIKSAPNLLKRMDPESNKMITNNGKMYGIVVPQNQEATEALIMREDWLAKAGISKVPQTLDEIKSTLIAFKKLDSNIIPFIAMGATNALDGLNGLKGAFGVCTSWREAGDSIEPTVITADFKNFISYVAALYAEGLIDKEYPTNKTDKRNEKIVSGRAGMTTIGWADMKNINEALLAKDPSAKLSVIGTAVGSDGRTGMYKNTPARVYLILPASSKVPKETINFLNMYVEDDIRNVVSYGWKDEHYKIENNLIVATQKAEDIRYRIYYQLWDTKEDFLNRVKLKGFGQYYDAMKKYSTLSDPTWYAPVIPIMQEKNQVLNDLQNEYFVKIITGAYPVSKFDEFVTKWKSAGGDAIIKAVNDWYKTSKK